MGYSNLSKEELIELVKKYEFDYAEFKQCRIEAKRFDNYLNAFNEGMLFIGGDGIIQRVNKRVCELFGYTKQELEGEKIEILIPDVLKDTHVMHREKFILNPVNRCMGQSYYVNGKKKNGNEIPLEVGLSFSNFGNQIQILALVTDVTIRKQFEDNLKESETRLSELNKTKDKFFSIISHDLRNP